jgi:hypothetical protein
MIIFNSLLIGKMDPKRVVFRCKSGANILDEWDLLDIMNDRRSNQFLYMGVRKIQYPHLYVLDTLNIIDLTLLTGAVRLWIKLLWVRPPSGTPKYGVYRKIDPFFVCDR